MAGMLTEADVRKLMTDPSPDARVETATKVAKAFYETELSPAERQLAEEIFRIMVRDAEVRVREALSINLKSSPELPKDVALSLAKDVEAVSLPVLEFSTVLSDSDLIEIIRLSGAEKQTAVARRANVSGDVANALIDHGKSGNVVATLVNNPGAALKDADLEKAFAKFGSDPAVSNSLVARSNLPLRVSEKIVALVSESLRDHLLSHKEISAEMAADLVLQARERATAGLLPPGSKSADVVELVQQLRDTRRLTPSLILRTLCTGDLTFFEASLAVLANMSVVNARVLIHDEGKLGLQSIYQRTPLPANLYPAFRVAFDVARETEYDGGANDRARFSARVIERVLTQFEDIGNDNLEYLMKKLKQLAA
ncbi:MAG: DUF2336 domain-containing protein [Proteobacteria bacterium]|nr:DUF2336 domain-containing protein [Pseudomonadota bacterium]